jgi:hypothetical protein
VNATANAQVGIQRDANAGAGAVRVELPADGCWVARSCELRVHVAAPLRLSAEMPALRSRLPRSAAASTSALEVLSIEGASPLRAPAGPDAWIVRVIAFEAGDLATPAMSVDVLDADSRHATLDVPAQTIAVRERAIGASSPLADLEALAPSAAAVLMVVAISVSAVAVLTAAASLLVRRRRRMAAWARAFVAPARARRRAARLLLGAGGSAEAEAEAGTIYDRIVEALRVALTPRIGSSVMALTSPEFLALAARSRMDDADRQSLAALLSRADGVRFGGDVPTPAQVTADLIRARRVVRSRRLARSPRHPDPRADEREQAEREAREAGHRTSSRYTVAAPTPPNTNDSAVSRSAVADADERRTAGNASTRR